MQNPISVRDSAASIAASQPSDSSSRSGLALPPPHDLAGRADHHLSQLVKDRPPASYSEFLLQVQVSRDAAGLDVAFEVEAGQFAGGNKGGAIRGTFAQAQALRAPIVHDTLRYQKHHVNGLRASLRDLTRLQSTRQDLTAPILFNHESECAAHVVEWQKQREWVCPACGEARRYWITDRLRFDCPCGKQYSALEGTVFANSRVPLLAWFTVISFVVVRAGVTPNEIAPHVEIRRKQTLRALVQTVRATLYATDGNHRLAGVPQLIAEYLHKVSQACEATEPLLTVEEGRK